MLAAAVLVMAPAIGDVIVVSPNGNDRSGNGSPGNPYATIGRALQRVRAGDTVLLLGGVYPATKVNATLKGTAEAPITIKAFPKENPVLEGTGASFGTWDSILNLNRSSHVVVEGIEFRG